MSEELKIGSFCYCVIKNKLLELVASESPYTVIVSLLSCRVKIHLNSITRAASGIRGSMLLS